MNRKLLVTIALALLVALAGCSSADSQPTPQENTDATSVGTIVSGEVPIDDGVIRFVDREAGVVCWAFAQDGGYDGQGGLACMPINETNLE